MSRTASALAQQESGRSVGRPVLYFTSDRSFADKPLTAALSLRECTAGCDGSGNGLGDAWRVRMSAAVKALRHTLR